MRVRWSGWWRRPAVRQRVFPFVSRADRLDRWFRRLILAATVLAVVGLVSASRAGRDAVRQAAASGRRLMVEWVGGVPDRAAVEAELSVRRAHTVSETRRSLDHYHDAEAPPAMRRLFDVTGMDPAHALIGTGRVTNGFVLSPRVFDPDAHGRSYRLKPQTRSVWLRQVTLQRGPFGLFLVPDTPEVRAAADAAGAVVDEPSRQSTSSWGLRGPEPDPAAPLRGIALGDSFMQGMFNGDDDTPPLDLERAVARARKTRVSVLNTGHIGYAPEQYFATLREYGERFRPHFVVVSVCPNDFGDEYDVMAGHGNDWSEAGYWLGEITQWCRSRQVVCLLVPVPTDYQIAGRRPDVNYPAPVSALFQGNSTGYLDALDAFINEHLRLEREARAHGRPSDRSLLYNRHIDDNHFSPAGARLWADVVAERLGRLLDRVTTPARP